MNLTSKVLKLLVNECKYVISVFYIKQYNSTQKQQTTQEWFNIIKDLRNPNLNT